jgi:hypothetical protein
MINGFGPASFGVTIGNGNVTNHCIQLTATGTPGEFTMAVGKQVDGGCSTATLHHVATLTLDDSSKILTCHFTDRFADRGWKSMRGVFNADGTGDGDIDDDSMPTGTSGLWSAGGSGEPFGERHERKHGHHA